jgi:proteasome lid subunit RPN8/RPN11
MHPPDYDGHPPLRLPDELCDEMVLHCLQARPIEACGLLAGQSIPVASSIYPLRNALASEMRYDADTNDLFQAFKSMRHKGEHLLAIYHSHPATLAIPSQTDLALNHYGALPRIIVSLALSIPVVRIWRFQSNSYEELAFA